MSEAEAMEQIIERAAAKIAADMRSIVAERVYAPDEAAHLIGLRSDRAPKSIREIPRSMLPIVRVTPGGRVIGYLGRDLLNYVSEQRKTA